MTLALNSGWDDYEEVFLDFVEKGSPRQTVQQTVR